MVIVRFNRLLRISSFRQVALWAQICALAALAIISGCSSGDKTVTPPLGKVKGKLTLDSKPAAELAVLFQPQTGRSSTGMTDRQGVYTLSFDAKHLGAVIGKHQVQITFDINKALAAGTVDASKGQPQQLPARYNTKTILEADVEAGDNEFNFDLTAQ